MASIFNIIFFIFFVFSCSVQGDEVRMVSPVTGLGNQSKHTLGLYLSLSPGWKMYGPHAGMTSGYPPSVELTKKENLKTFQILWPEEKDIIFQGVQSQGYFEDILVPIHITVQDPLKNLSIEGNISYLVCNTVCVPKKSTFFLFLPAGESLESDDAALFEDVEISPQSESLDLMFLFAFLGGLILNFMPCVLPVLSLKMMSFAHKGHHRLSSFLTFLGILLSFLILAGISISFRMSGEALHWGAQFQSSYFLIFMILIMLFFTANLWGLFEVGQGFVYRIPVINHKTIIADIWNGFVAVFLATPCSAPFLGTALSFTLTQGPWTVLMIFVCMAFGFGFPYILLTLIPPSWVPLPKPGRWMKTLKETLGWGMYMTALWLIWILDDHMTIFPFLLFIFPVIALFRQKIIFIVNLSLFVCVAVILLMLSSPKASLPFEGEAKVQEHVSGGKIVVVKLSAKWCISCALIDHQIFQDPEILRMTSDSRVEIITGEWTQPSTDISAYLALKNRLGIPLIVIYGPKLPQGIVLSEFPSKEEVIKALHDVGL